MRPATKNPQNHATVTKAVPRFASRSCSSIVDNLGAVKAQIANLELKEATLRQKLIDSGMEVIEGKLFRCTVTESERTDYNYAKIIAALPKTPQLQRLMRKYRKASERHTVKVVARR